MLRLVSFAAAAVMVLAIGSPAAAVTPSPTTVTTVSNLQLSASDCAALAASLNVTVATLKAAGGCSIKQTDTLTRTPVSASAAPSSVTPTLSCYTEWNIDITQTESSLFWGVFWSANAHGTGYGDSCGNDMWTSVTCGSSGFGFTVTFTWCGAWPQEWTWYSYTQTNFGANFNVTVLVPPFPISSNHGVRASFDPYTGSTYDAYGW